MKRKTRYYLKLKNAWFIAGEPYGDDDPKLLPPYSSDRMFHARRSLDRVVQRLTAVGWEIQFIHMVKVTIGRPQGRQIRTWRSASR
jgi:hypothetical protein